MSRFWGLARGAAACALAGSCLAAPAAAQQVEAGEWINLFDGESTFGWNNFGDAEWLVAEGVLTAAKGSGGWLATTSQFKDFELVAKVRVSRPGTTGLVVRGGLEGHPTANGGTVIPLGGQEGEAVWQEVVVKALGDTIGVTVDGDAVEVRAGSRAKGHIGVQYHAYHRYNHTRRPPTVEVSEVKLRPLRLTAIFDGETLDGWNILPDRASVFTVQEGALNITNGNGQIETAGVYKDFLLQMDIISNGERLNSGVFFRGPVGQFWLGYESQLYNGWVGKDRTRPMDYGTGGIYGVQETRKVVPNDFEWFNKTIVCDGNHMAVWINGYQVADLYDTRPVDARGDAKNGFVPEAGTIHLQGHDPGTNLSFKNIHISEY